MEPLLPPLSRRRLLQGGIGLAAAGTVGTAASCGSSASSTPAGFTEVTFSSIGDTKTQRMFQDVIAAAQEETLDDLKIKVVWKPAPGDDWASVMLQFASGTTSDIQRIDDDRVYDLATSGKILQLDKMMADPSTGFDLSQYSSTFTSKVAVEGYQFSITPAMSANVLYYNKKLFADAGLTAPTSWSQAWSWDEFDSAVKALTKRSGDRTEVYGLQFLVNTIQATAYGAGDTALNEDQTECGYAKPETLEAIDRQVAYIREGYAPTVDVEFLPLFNAGKLAMTWQGMEIGNQISDDVEWDIMPWPKTPMFAMTKNYARTWVIPKTAKDPEAAFAALKALSGRAASEVMAKARFAVPAMTEVATSAAFTDHPFPTTPTVWSETLDDVDGRSVDIPFPRGPIGTVLADAFVEGVNANGLVSGKLPTAEYLRIGRAMVNAEIKKRNWDVTKGTALLEQGGALTDPDTKVGSSGS